MLKSRRSSVVELHLPHDVVEFILEGLPAKSLLRFKSVSKKWKSTIESQFFKEQQFIRRRQSGGPVLLVAGRDSNTVVQGISCDWCSMICHGSCDGLLWLSCDHKPNYVVNPATRWHQAFPLSIIQQLLVQNHKRKRYYFSNLNIGFGKDKVRATYKPVWLYNFSEFGLNNVTSCEIFDFSINAWRYVHPDFPLRINDCHSPVYLDGSLHCLTLCEEPKVISFDLHTETFQVICKAPYTPKSDDDICILDNRLCLSEERGLTLVIWSFDSSGGNKTWEKLCSLDLTKTLSWFNEFHFPLAPIAIVDKNKLLLQGQYCLDKHVIHDLHAKSYDLILLKPETRASPVYYFQRKPKPRRSPVYYYESLFSVLSN